METEKVMGSALSESLKISLTPGLIKRMDEVGVSLIWQQGVVCDVGVASHPGLVCCLGEGNM